MLGCPCPHTRHWRRVLIEFTLRIKHREFWSTHFNIKSIRRLNIPFIRRAGLRIPAPRASDIIAVNNLSRAERAKKCNNIFVSKHCIYHFWAPKLCCFSLRITQFWAPHPRAERAKKFYNILVSKHCISHFTAPKLCYFSLHTTQFSAPPFSQRPGRARSARALIRPWFRMTDFGNFRFEIYMPKLNCPQQIFKRTRNTESETKSCIMNIAQRVTWFICYRHRQWQ